MHCLGPPCSSGRSCTTPAWTLVSLLGPASCVSFVLFSKSPEQFFQPENRISLPTDDVDAAAAAPGLSALIVRWLTRWCGGWGWTVARETGAKRQVVPVEISHLRQQTIRYETQLSCVNEAVGDRADSGDRHQLSIRVPGHTTVGCSPRAPPGTAG